MIAVNDIVLVILPEGVLLQDYIVKDIPGPNNIYWELEDPVSNEVVVVGPSLLSMRVTGV